ncbi:MAG: bifunctional folylpolyglutamate synthase/dihydrofolate synthase [Planctomycetaceae bacterium]|nr:bifunctional folylpolyglutamate synthase/dihydrofolate synthase [Planctomycetales bacterium]MCB9940565.1 bifunctional folylpolyglutamate synthase/dihydrofolate synthase [Planctomycetaceae bacterium]
MDGSASAPDGKYQSALEFLYGRINYERTDRGVPGGSQLKLDRMQQLLDALGNPQESLKAVHIAGTKGKGSTAEMIACALTAAGFRTGLYTSPHLEKLEERISIDGADCTSAELVKLVEAVRPAVAELDQKTAKEDGLGNPTFFEITTAMAMLHFVDHGVDVAVLEVGLGGRLDSTNVCRPVVTVITSISFDHIQQLGNTLAAIAREKAGIVKPAIPLICGVTQSEPLNVIQQIAVERGARIYQIGEDFGYRYAPPLRNSPNLSGGVIDYRDSLSRDGTQFDAVRVGMLGSHQASNAAIAIATLRRMQEDGWNVPEPAIRDGIANARCTARIEVLSREPTVIVDTAHNLASIEALLSALDESFDDQHRLLIFAATRDKDVSGMLRLLLPRFETVILTRYVENPRGVAPERLLELVERLRDELQPVPSVIVCDSPSAAWEKAQATATPEHLVCISGSFFLAAEMRPMIETRGTAPTP